MNSLFRREAIEHVSSQRYGHIVLAKTISFSLLTYLFVAIAFSIVLFFVLFSYTRKAQLVGVLLPEQGLIRVLPMQSGVVVEQRAYEGQLVQAGEVLFVLSNERSSITEGEIEQRISTLLQSRIDSLFADQEVLQRQTAQRLTALQQRAADLAQEYQQFHRQINLQTRRVQLSKETVKRHQKLHEAHFISMAGLQEKQAEEIEQQSRLLELQRAQAAIKKEQHTVQSDIKEAQLQAQRDQAVSQRNVSTIEQDLTENEARRRVVIRAPQAGTISAITVSLGQAVASLSPVGSPLVAELYAPSQAAGFVKPGMTVLLRYKSYPYQKFGQFHGTVGEVSNTGIRSEDLALPIINLPPGSTTEPLYRVKVMLDRQSVPAYGKSQPLKAGMTLEASILLEKRALYEWILEPLHSLKGSLS